VEEQYEVDRSCESTITNTVDWYLMKKEKPFVDCTEMDAGCDGLFINSYDRDSLTCVFFLLLLLLLLLFLCALACRPVSLRTRRTGNSGVALLRSRRLVCVFGWTDLFPLVFLGDGVATVGRQG